MTRPEILAALAEFSRPQPDWSGFKASQLSFAAAKEWDAANPELAARRWVLVGQLEDIERLEADEFRSREIGRYVARALKTSGASEREVAAARAPDADYPGLSAAREWWETNVTWLVLSGTPGTGKSVAGAWLVLQALEAGQTAQFRKATELASLSLFNEGRDELERLKRVSLLVVDDFGTENLTDHAGGLLFSLFDARHSERKRTVLTSNLVGHTLTARFGERIADRIAQDGVAKELRGKSLRRTPKSPTETR